MEFHAIDHYPKGNCLLHGRTDLRCQISGEILSAVRSRKVARGLSPSVHRRSHRENLSHQSFGKSENRDLVVLEIPRTDPGRLSWQDTCQRFGRHRDFTIADFRSVEPLCLEIAIHDFSIESQPSKQQGHVAEDLEESEIGRLGFSKTRKPRR